MLELKQIISALKQSLFQQLFEFYFCATLCSSVINELDYKGESICRKAYRSISDIISQEQMFPCFLTLSKQTHEKNVHGLQYQPW